MNGEIVSLWNRLLRPVHKDKTLWNSIQNKVEKSASSSSRCSTRSKGGSRKPGNLKVSGNSGSPPGVVLRASYLQEILTSLTNPSSGADSTEDHSKDCTVITSEIENATEDASLSSTLHRSSSSDVGGSERLPVKVVLPAGNDSDTFEGGVPDSGITKVDGFRSSGSDDVVTSCERPYDAPKRMSLLEQKRLQWAAERAQMREWDPWGRPGGGAPHVALGDNRHTVAEKDWNKTNNCNYQLATSPLQVSCEFNQQNGRLPPLPPVPAALATSLTFGNATSPYDGSYDSWKEEAKKNWLNELDKQREEQRMRKLEEKGYYQKTLLPNNIISDQISLNNLSLANRTAPALINTTYAPATDGIDAASPTSPTSNNIDANNGGGNDPDGPQRTFLRGANIPIDSKTQLELTKKREKALEQQNAIRLQLEERLRLKREERERQKKEEREEEARLARERERIEEQFVHEQEKLKLKEEMKSQQREALVEAIIVARKSAEQARERKAPTSRLPDVLDGTDSGRKVENEVVLSVPKIEVSPRNSLKVPTDDSTQPYVFNRILTPTKYREIKNLLTRDCATQTDFQTTGCIPFKKDRATITTNDRVKGQDSDSTSGGQRNQKGKSKVTRKKASKPTEQKDRPQWGSNRTQANKKQPQPSKQRPNQAASSTEAAKPDPAPKVQSGSRRFSGSRTRSSAEQQRKIIAQEGAMNSHRVCLSPLPATRPTATDSSTTGDDASGAPTRRRRRQWESPGRDELPNFYTNSPLLPDVRNVRRVSVSSSSALKAEATANKPPTGDTRWVPFRSNSPPVPALRHRLEPQTAAPPPISLEVQNIDPGRTFILADDGPGARMTVVDGRILETTELDIVADPPKSREWHVGLEDVGNIVSPVVNRRSSTPSFVQNERDLVTSSWSLGAPPSYFHQQMDILKKMTLIRQGLLLRQQEIDTIMASAENSKNENKEVPEVKGIERQDLTHLFTRLTFTRLLGHAHPLKS